MCRFAYFLVGLGITIASFTNMIADSWVFSVSSLLRWLGMNGFQIRPFTYMTCSNFPLRTTGCSKCPKMNVSRHAWNHYHYNPLYFSYHAHPKFVVFLCGCACGNRCGWVKALVGAFLLASVPCCNLWGPTHRYSLCKSTFSSGRLLHILCTVVGSCIWISCFCNFCYLRPSFIDISVSPFLGWPIKHNTLHVGRKHQSDKCHGKIVDIVRRAKFTTLHLSVSTAPIIHRDLFRWFPCFYGAGLGFFLQGGHGKLFGSRRLGRWHGENRISTGVYVMAINDKFM